MATAASLIHAALCGAAMAALQSSAPRFFLTMGEVAMSALVHPGDLQLGDVPAAVRVPGEVLQSGYCSGNSNKYQEVTGF